MNIKLNSKELLERLQYLSGVVTANNALPILEYFLFEVGNKELKITASDLESTMTAKMSIEGEYIGSIAIPSKLLIDILKALPSQPIEFKVMQNSQIVIISSSGNYSIAYQDGAEYPKPKEIEEPTTISLPTDVLERAIKKTVFATGNDDLRPVMNGVLFQMRTTGMIFVATDAHRLVKFSRTDHYASADVDFVVPKKPLNILKAVLEKTGELVVEIQYNSHNASFTFGDYDLKTRLVDAKYPNYEAVIPKDNPNEFSVDTAEFMSSLKRVSLFSNKITHQVAIKQKATVLNLVAEDIDYSTNGKETIECDPKTGEIEIGFNARFLAEALNNVDDSRVVLETSAPNRAGIVRPENNFEEGEELLMLVMPVMLNS
ncbi:DNA polymerase III subunit beta [Flavobacterium sp. 102]|uniref:DNA polymerase III subunit beta n=1 Tax=Flavobacterium sp. 102 TaxID=2135623 RepID=UPI000EB1D367|nr:DNA polymerase III subunit beta [Flavobacterium sp. 102]RKS00443.1 DNA polymerase III beta subunit [Flavobacterium sp. 102]